MPHPPSDEMMGSKTELVLYGTDSALLENLQKFSTDLTYISYETGFGPQVVVNAGLDAIWATPMVGVELFGAVPPFPLHEARVYETPTAQLERGMPRYGIVGVTTSERDSKTPEFELRLVLSSLLKAVRDFNARHQERIQRVGILPEDLGLKRLNPARAFDLIRDIYQNES